LRAPTETVTEENFFFKLSAFTESCWSFTNRNPISSSPRRAATKCCRSCAKGSTIFRSPHKHQVGHSAEGEGAARLLRLVRRADGLYERGRGQGLWPADLHLIGKEILRFHAVFWPAFLMAADCRCPRKSSRTAGCCSKNDKMSKSRGNIVRSEPIREVMGADALRYFLLREVVFGQDGSFSYDALIGRYNSDLANGLGNLASRTLTMIGSIAAARFRRVRWRSHRRRGAADHRGRGRGLRRVRILARPGSRLGTALQAGQIHRRARALEAGAQPEAQADLDATLYTAAEALRIATVLLAPVLPQSTPKIWAQLGMTEPLESVRLDTLAWGQLPAGQKIGEDLGVFPRIEPKRPSRKCRSSKSASPKSRT
jgi:methionyl-tRNA synthetase